MPVNGGSKKENARMARTIAISESLQPETANAKWHFPQEDAALHYSRQGK
jgi:hypothetical protein